MQAHRPRFIAAHSAIYKSVQHFADLFAVHIFISSGSKGFSLSARVLLCPVDQRFDRFLADLHDLGDFAVGKLLIFIQNESSPLLIRRLPKRRASEHSISPAAPEAGPGKQKNRGRGPFENSPTVGRPYYSPHYFRRSADVRLTYFVEAHVGGNPVQPCSELSLHLVPGGRFVDFQKYFLRQFLCHPPVTHKPVCEVDDSVCVPGKQLFECLRVSIFKTEHQSLHSNPQPRGPLSCVSCSAGVIPLPFLCSNDSNTRAAKKFRLQII